MRDQKKLAKAFGQGAFGMIEVPQKMGFGHYGHLEHPEESELTTKSHRRSWKKHRKQRWRPK